MRKDIRLDNMVWNHQSKWTSMREWHDEDLVFVKSEQVSNNKIWRLFAADGTELGVADSRDLALIMARQHNLVPYSVN